MICLRHSVADILNFLDANHPYFRKDYADRASRNLLTDLIETEMGKVLCVEDQDRRLLAVGIITGAVTSHYGPGIFCELLVIRTDVQGKGTVPLIRDMIEMAREAYPEAGFLTFYQRRHNDRARVIWFRRGNG